ncbi:MAG: toll/interleukin-1 receptor domain-containing protein [Hyphomicrobiales bacterium]
MQIFISYARDDDKPPPDMPDAKGFVTYLHEQLIYEFTHRGAPRPKLWRDTKRIEDGDPFESRIEQAINESSILLVVLSNNWMNRPYCKLELDSFAKRWTADPGLRERIVVAGKRHVENDKRYSLLQGQVGYMFYALDDHDAPGGEHEFYRGRVRDPVRLEERIEQLAGHLWRKAVRMSTKTEVDDEVRVPVPPTPAPSNNRMIYVAKPAADMREAYDRVVRELTGRGFAVTPEPSSEIPRDASATAAIDEALAKAELSVHLLGERPGYAPEDQEHIVKLQLMRAAKRGEPGNAGSAKGGDFRRIIFAPRAFEHVTPSSVTPLDRNPLDVLGKFDRQLDTDKIDGNDLSKFVDFLTQHLERRRPVELRPPSLKADARIYLYHRDDDTDYAVELYEALQSRRVEPVLPVLEGTPAELGDAHRKKLSECDAVVLCWAAASEAWVRAQADELRDWQKFDRAEKFAYRGVVAGPPPGGRKKVLLRVPPRNEIDVVVDLTGCDHPTPEQLDPLIPDARANGS